MYLRLRGSKSDAGQGDPRSGQAYLRTSFKSADELLVRRFSIVIRRSQQIRRMNGDEVMSASCPVAARRQPQVIVNAQSGPTGQAPSPTAERLRRARDHFRDYFLLGFIAPSVSPIS